jgi:cyanophycinase
MNRPKGVLIAVGGAEDKGSDLEKGYIERNNLNFFELGILKNVVKESGEDNPLIEVITTASSIPKEVGSNYIDAFSKLGCTRVGHLNIRDRNDVTDPAYIARVQQAGIIMFSGGNQLRLTSIYGGTEILNIIHQRYLQENLIVAGTSAGAMAMSNTMIYEGNSARAHIKGEVKITTGLAFIKDVIFDSHFDKRGRFGRLAQAVGANPGCLGIGLGEDTGMIIRKGHHMEAIGSGMVIIVDGHQIRHNNIADLPEGTPFSIENLRVHFMAHGNRFDIVTRTFEANVAKQVEK